MTNITLLQSKTLPDSYLQQLCKCFQATFSYPQVTSSLSMLPAPGQPKVSPEARGHEATSTGIGRASDCHGPVCQVVCCQTRPDRLAADGLQTVCEAERAVPVVILDTAAGSSRVLACHVQSVRHQKHIKIMLILYISDESLEIQQLSILQTAV